MAAVNSAVTRAATPASSQVTTGNLVNVAAGTPATPIWPGAVNSQQYLDPGPKHPVEGPVSVEASPVAPGNSPVVLSGGGVLDATYLEGHNAPMVPWDSSAGQPFAPSGAVDPCLHGQDLGAPAIALDTTPAFIGQLIREVPMGQTWNEEAPTQNTIGNVSPNNRQDLDQIQMHDPAPGDGGGYAPWDPGYAERPVLLNVAYQSHAINPAANQYGVNGLLPDRSQFSYQAQAYETPGEPIVSQPAQATPGTTTGGGWLLNG